MSLSDEQFEFLKDVSLLIQFCVKNNQKITGGELLRTEYQQKEYLRTGRSKTMNSNHLKKLAIDFNFIIDGKLCNDKKTLQYIGDFWESLNKKNKWGGNWSGGFIDTPHFERRS